MTDSPASSNRMPNSMLAIASGKGGVGKTWLSITLAHLIARSGRRVLLFDGDIGLANVDVQLGLSVEQDLARYFAGKATLEQCVTPYESGGFDVLAGRSGSGALGSLPTEKLRQFGRDMATLSRHYDMVLLDLGAGVDVHARFICSLANRVLMVMTDEPTSLTDAYAFIKLARRDVPNLEVMVAVNQVANKKEGEKTFAALQSACKNFLKFDPTLAGIIRKDNKVREAIRQQDSIINRAPGTTAATDAAALSVKLMTRRG